LLSRLRTGVPAVLAMLALSAGLVTASIPNSLTGVISGCYAKSGGTLRVIDAQAGETCKKGELSVWWNQTGPPGPTGAPGEQGPPGPPGPASLTALAGTECVRQNATSGTVVVTVGNDDSVTITCEGTAPNWCLTHTPDVGAHMTVTCDESTDTLTFTCDTTWYDFNTNYTDGCEAQLEALPQTVATVQAAADYLLAGTHDFEVVADCTSLPTIACPGGIPSDPLPTVRMVGTNVVATGLIPSPSRPTSASRRYRASPSRRSALVAPSTWTRWQAPTRSPTWPARSCSAAMTIRVASRTGSISAP
jgi:hypothetical protein